MSNYYGEYDHLSNSTNDESDSDTSTDTSSDTSSNIDDMEDYYEDNEYCIFNDNVVLFCAYAGAGIIMAMIYYVSDKYFQANK